MNKESLTDEQAVEQILGRMNDDDGADEGDELPEGDEGEELDGELEESEGELEDDESEQLDEDEEEQEDGEDTIQTVAELAESLGIPEEELTDQLKYKFRANGEDVELTLKQLRDRHQSYVGLEKQQQRIVETSKEVNELRDKKMEELEQYATQHAASLNALEQAIYAETQTPEMQELQRDDPTAYLIKEREIGGRLNWIRQQREQGMAQYQQAREQDKAERFKQAASDLSKAYPDFNDNIDLYTKKVHNSLTPLGFAPDEIQQISDSRLLIGAIKLADALEQVETKNKTQEAAGKAAGKLKKTIPKLASATQGKSGVNRSRVAKIARRFKKNPTEADAIALIESRL